MDDGKKGEVDMIENRKDGPANIPQNSGLIEEEGAGVPAGYWYSPRFIGSTVAIVLLANNLFIGYAMPVRLNTNTPISSYIVKTKLKPDKCPQCHQCGFRCVSSNFQNAFYKTNTCCFRPRLQHLPCLAHQHSYQRGVPPACGQY